MKRLTALATLGSALAAGAAGQRLRDFTTPLPLPPGSTLVVGFLGGFERWNDPHRGVRKLALRLRAANIPGLYVETVENHRRRAAMTLIRRAIADNRQGARIILYGQSWGGASVIKTARDLEKWDVPVLLTVQVDSVGAHDAVIPANVRAAANFYQRDPFTAIHGRTEIRAADPARTEILGNFRFSYILHDVDQSDASWARRKFGGSHNKMELDPAVWDRVEQLIRDAAER